MLSLLALLASAAMAAPLAQAASLTVSAATSLSNALREIGPAFEAQHPGVRLRFNFAASDALLAQIARGAPVDVFASADLDSMDRAQAQGLLVPGSRRSFASNALVVVQPADSRLQLASLADLTQPGVRRIALGRPDGVPAGRYTRTALQAAGLWTALEPRAVYAANVRQALDYVARGEVEAGFVYATDVAAQAGKVRRAFSVPTAAPITYPVAVVAGSAQAEAARRFIDHLLSPDAQAVLARHGFLKP